jgi:signal peptidase I
VGLPGETVEVKAGKVYIDDKELTEEYIQSDSNTTLDRNYAKTKLANEEYFVFGDNRDHSSDSREIGSVPRVNIQGRVAIVLLPLQDIGFPFIPKYAF